MAPKVALTQTGSLCHLALHGQLPVIAKSERCAAIAQGLICGDHPKHFRTEQLHLRHEVGQSLRPTSQCIWEGTALGTFVCLRHRFTIRDSWLPEPASASHARLVRQVTNFWGAFVRETERAPSPPPNPKKRRKKNPPPPPTPKKRETHLCGEPRLWPQAPER